MKIPVSDDLVVEVCPAAPGDQAVVVLRSLDIERDGQAAPGVVVVWPEEIRPLAAALAEAAGVLAEWAANANG